MENTQRVSNCTECQDQECVDAAHQPEALPKACSCIPCAKPPTFFAVDVTAAVHAACNDHAKYVPGWLADATHEVRCDGLAASRYEDMAFGRD